ncbi:hypothetical protein [Pseudoduganella rhizocola]|uniref:hypothetical protein n=1 Tax=Pseudoduganella rhizocola TaxID=3382643 RepID=UPI0038B5C21C
MNAFRTIRRHAAPVRQGRSAGTVLLSLLCLPLAAGAAGVPEPPATVLPVAALLQGMLPARLAAAPAGALPEQQLEAQRGGTDRPWSDMKLGGTVSGNSATNVVTGANLISDGAFANANGLPMVIQNSGANVLIQNATIVNIQMK